MKTRVLALTLAFAAVCASPGNSDDKDLESSGWTVTDVDGKSHSWSGWELRSAKGAGMSDLPGRIGRIEADVPTKDIARLEVTYANETNGEVSVTLTTKSGEKLDLSRVDGNLRLAGKTSWGTGKVRLADLKSLENANVRSRKCDKCSREYLKPEWSFCPHDGTPLK